MHRLAQFIYMNVKLVNDLRVKTQTNVGYDWVSGLLVCSR